LHKLTSEQEEDEFSNQKSNMIYPLLTQDIMSKEC